jgi:ribulose-5-phosphate 4-epimerase/fuculose-1-phosphate aldolase
MSERLDAERTEIRTQIAGTLRVFGRFGFQWGNAGHLTARDPGEEERYWVNPVGVPYVLTKASDIVLVNSKGDVVEGKHEVAGFHSQLAIHRARTDLPAAVHVHSPYGFAWSSAGGILDALNTDSAGIHALQAYRASFDQPVDTALGPEARILVQKGHGFIAAGATIAEAAFYLLSAERAAHVQLTLEAAGRLERLPEEVVAKATFRPAGADRAFHIYLDEELTRDPSLVD